MDNISSSDTIISNLKSSVETLIHEFEQIKLSSVNIQDADSLEKLEINLHAKATKLADLIAAIKLQGMLNSNELEESEKRSSVPNEYHVWVLPRH